MTKVQLQSALFIQDEHEENQLREIEGIADEWEPQAKCQVAGTLH